MKYVFSIVFFILFTLPAAAQTPRSFKGYACTKNCSGHKAGYDWAKKKNVTDPAVCKGKSKSFVEGCRAFTVEFEDAPAGPMPRVLAK